MAGNVIEVGAGSVIHFHNRDPKTGTENDQIYMVDGILPHDLDASLAFVFGYSAPQCMLSMIQAVPSDSPATFSGDFFPDSDYNPESQTLKMPVHLNRWGFEMDISVIDPHQVPSGLIFKGYRYS